MGPSRKTLLPLPNAVFPVKPNHRADEKGISGAKSTHLWPTVGKKERRPITYVDRELVKNNCALLHQSGEKTDCGAKNPSRFAPLKRNPTFNDYMELEMMRMGRRGTKGV